MKVAVSIPDRIFESAERLAKQRRVPRSQIFAEALSAYVESRSAEAITARLNDVYGKEESALDAGLAQAQLESLNHEAW
jgi:metal-responsive CopG/Arc/MetJ family transcriptional regulator